ncbi:hypothetical protein FPE01S_03_07700 [Flavihumibacter petaseus NBRC 106054]|uniref:MORN repeat protein n=1 Tax=Flavihumibacter petaseus NBRC 106054 TaxID=1220578 RepID=A0A0E9N4W7_9BACT|nr:hypothetical protein FPE01S_03_07700 [Flavihumibacter petaseus NBRC 106054]
MDNRKYQVYFNEAEVVLTEDYYKTVPPSARLYNGRSINRSNKFGFREGLWIEFFKDGHEKSVTQYPDQSLFFDPDPLWSKTYYPSGQLSGYIRTDTSESWFDNGQPESQFITRKGGDTSFYSGYRKYNAQQLAQEFSEKSYPTIFTSEFDPQYKQEGSITEIVFKKEYFQNGNPKFVYGKDTSVSWFETGQIESKRYRNGKKQFNQKGNLTEQSFSWLEKGPEHWRNLENTLYVQFYPNGKIREIELVRDEPTEDGIAPGVRYTWAWDKKMHLTESPENWTEPLPWTRFPALRVRP